jgi:uncharacterized ubiquitin-like protein YukD
MTPRGNPFAAGWLKGASAVSCIALLAGCAGLMTFTDHYDGLRTRLAACDYGPAMAQIEAAKGVTYKRKDGVLYYLDLGMLQHFAGQPKESNRSLESAQLGIEAAFTKSVSQAAASILLNDNTLDYAGEDYEDVYLNVFKALNYLAMREPAEAFVELRRMNEKLSVLEDRYGRLAAGLNASSNAVVRFRPGTSRFHNSALGRYLSMLAYRSEGRMDEARIDAEKISEAWAAQPAIYRFSMPDLRPQLAPAASPRLDFICFTGLGPRKGSETYYVHTEDGLLLVGRSSKPPDERTRHTFVPIPWKGINGGLHLKFSVPVLYAQTSAVARVEAVVDGMPVTLAPIELLQDVAAETFRVKEPLIRMRSLTRMVLKGLAAHEAKKRIRRETKDKNDADLACLLVDLSLYATESADLRISHCFPAEALIGETAVRAGMRNVEFRYYGRNGSLIHTDRKGKVEVSDSGLNLVQSAYLN